MSSRRVLALLVCALAVALGLPAAPGSARLSSATVTVTTGAAVVVHAASGCTVACIDPVGRRDARLGWDQFGRRLPAHPAAPNPVVFPMTPTSGGFTSAPAVPVGVELALAAKATGPDGTTRIGYLRLDPDGRYYLTARFDRAARFTVPAEGLAVDATSYVVVREALNQRRLVRVTHRRKSPCPEWNDRTRLQPDVGGTHVFLQLERKDGSWATMTRQTTRRNGAFDFGARSLRQQRAYRTKQYDLRNFRQFTDLQRILVRGDVVNEPVTRHCYVTYGRAGAVSRS